MDALNFTLNPAQVLNSNQRLNHYERAGRTKTLRLLGRVQTLAAIRDRNLVPYDRPVGIRVAIVPPSNRRFDPPNLWPTVKALIDGMVDAGLLWDDAAVFVPETTFAAGEARHQVKGKWVLRFTFHHV